MARRTNCDVSVGAHIKSASTINSKFESLFNMALLRANPGEYIEEHWLSLITEWNVLGGIYCGLLVVINCSKLGIVEKHCTQKEIRFKASSILPRPSTPK